MNFIVLYSTSPAFFSLSSSITVAGDASRHRLTPLARRGATLREPAGRRCAPRGQPAALAAGLPRRPTGQTPPAGNAAAAASAHGHGVRAQSRGGGRAGLPDGWGPTVSPPFIIFFIC